MLHDLKSNTWHGPKRLCHGCLLSLCSLAKTSFAQPKATSPLLLPHLHPAQRTCQEGLPACLLACSDLACCTQHNPPAPAAPRAACAACLPGYPRPQGTAAAPAVTAQSARQQVVGAIAYVCVCCVTCLCVCVLCEHAPCVWGRSWGKQRQSVLCHI
jgi:hypothetical protein